VDFSRLWWLLATEAAMQVRNAQHPSSWRRFGTEVRSGWTHRELSRLRADARRTLAHEEVIV
jgi:hypothetical protein